MTLTEQIRAWMDGREDELVAALAPLIAVDSTTGEAAPGMPFGEGPAEALRRALALAENWGFATGNDDGYVGTVDLNDKEDRLHILAHLDVVNVGDGWDTDPFTLVRKGDLIFGRGTDDDKGPAVAALLAMRCVRELGMPLTGNVRLILGTDEETGSRDIQHYYSSHPFAPNAVTPDSTFPVTNVEKAHYGPRFSHSWQAQPPVRGHVAEMKGGIRVNVAPANCTARIVGIPAEEAAPILADVDARTGVKLTAQERENGLVLTAVGVEAHAAYPDGGKNAITAMLEALCLLPLAEDEAGKTIRNLHRLFPYGDNEGKALGIAMSDEVSGKLTLTLSLLELDETGFWARFDSRDPICATPETTKGVVEGVMQGLGWACKGEFGAAHYVPEDTDFIRTLLECYETFSGKKGYCEYTGGGTYVHYIPGGVAFGAGDRDFESHLHSANERASLKQLLICAEIYAAVIAKLCQ